MRIVIFGATGMVGKSALLAATKDPRVTSILTVGRNATGMVHDKLTELVVPDVGDLSSIQDRLTNLDACVWALGVSAVGLTEDEYRAITHTATMKAAATMKALNPALRMLYVSGGGTNINGRQMWARVKGQTEADLTATFTHAYMFRPGAIFSRDGIESRTTGYRRGEKVLRLFQAIIPDSVSTDTRRIGTAMLNVLVAGGPSRVYENRDINVAATLA